MNRYSCRRSIQLTLVLLSTSFRFPSSSRRFAIESRVLSSLLPSFLPSFPPRPPFRVLIEIDIARGRDTEWWWYKGRLDETGREVESSNEKKKIEEKKGRNEMEYEKKRKRKLRSEKKTRVTCQFLYLCMRVTRSESAAVASL